MEKTVKELKFSEEDMIQLVKSSFYAGLSKGQGKNKDFNIDDYVKEHLQQSSINSLAGSHLIDNKKK